MQTSSHLLLSSDLDCSHQVKLKQESRLKRELEDTTPLESHPTRLVELPCVLTYNSGSPLTPYVRGSHFWRVSSRHHCRRAQSGRGRMPRGLDFVFSRHSFSQSYCGCLRVCCNLYECVHVWLYRCLCVLRSPVLEAAPGDNLWSPTPCCHA